MEKLYVIEARDHEGKLLFGDTPQPYTVFGDKAITGITDWEMSRVIFRLKPDATLEGGSIPDWPRLINPYWVARHKYW